ncbi:conserved protein of unknown function [Methylacidimicrobium sp. AP8]|uniref:hypothetical protein n=1 Tax=Methylacidimicrobium sp. AP8 TaxID=2730359 RepID=UPI0018C01F63|nr:hypothetical protein [Methylacidimicrobium sp. AP8]CAB4243587.1 conserved protein of unknown function [Methylacidimicrobium sp. AP8]
MEAGLLLILYSGLLWALRGVPPPPAPSGRLAVLLWQLVCLGWWPHGAFLRQDPKAKWIASAWIAGTFLLGRASLFAPHSPLAYSLDQLGNVAAGLCLLAGFGLAAFQLRARAEEATPRAQENPPPPRALVALREDEGVVRLPGHAVQAARRLAPKLYVMPGEAAALLGRDRVVSLAPWPPEAEAVETALVAVQEKLAQTEERALALSLEKDRAMAGLRAIEGRLEELERARSQLVKDLARMRAESRLGSQSEFYRLSEEELIQAREVRRKEILWIEQILEVRQKAGAAEADPAAPEPVP